MYLKVHTLLYTKQASQTLPNLASNELDNILKTHTLKN